MKYNQAINHYARLIDDVYPGLLEIQEGKFFFCDRKISCDSLDIDSYASNDDCVRFFHNNDICSLILFLDKSNGSGYLVTPQDKLIHDDQCIVLFNLDVRVYYYKNNKRSDGIMEYDKEAIIRRHLINNIMEC